ncbi:unnamed protein product [Gulo gulo]|uniref:Uncharacterized protein n=1 Tax=Gulo gulo TaxID=48420 RepID=A0A9X9PU90_GULGU|nr:unnamed protein product [Gulo gulo]
MCTRGASACMCMYTCGVQVRVCARVRGVCACVGRWAQDASPALECVSLALQARASASFRAGRARPQGELPSDKREKVWLAGREGEGGQAAGAAACGAGSAFLTGVQTPPCCAAGDGPQHYRPAVTSQRSPIV